VVGVTLELVPVTFADAAAFVGMHHRHNRPPTLVGVAIVGRPVARHFDDGRTLEVNRTATDGTRNANSKLYATDGTRNANSKLYGACWSAAKALGYRRLITYTQGDETGASLHGAGWRIVAQRPPRPGWNAPSRPRGDHGEAWMPRTLWEAV
jgi:hypothetical protein